MSTIPPDDFSIKYSVNGFMYNTEKPGGEQLIHANCIALKNAGLLIIGGSATGKSSLSLMLLERAQLFNYSAALISDDYTYIYSKQDKATTLFGRAAPHMKGAIEIRGAGIYRLPALDCVQLSHAILLNDEKALRYPDDSFFVIGRVELPLLKLPSVRQAPPSLLCQAIEAFCFKCPW